MSTADAERMPESNPLLQRAPESSAPSGLRRRDRWSALRERLALDDLDYPIAPTANRFPYMLGGLTFVGLIILIITGIFLDQFFNPSPLAAHDSVLYIMTRVRLGNWIRAIHYWAATLVFISVFAHIAWVFWRRSYTRPREVTWWSGVTLFIIVFGLIFTGTVLRGDQEAAEALAHAVAGAKLAPTLGSVLSPAFALSTPLFSRLHNAHVSVLPLALVALIGLHFSLIRSLGIHAHEPKTSRFTYHLRRLTGAGLLLFALIGLLAAVFPPGIGHPGIEGVEVTKPYWPFLWIYSVENTLGMIGMIVAPIVLFGFLVVVPFLDRGHHHVRDDGSHELTPRSRWLMSLALLMLLLYVGGILYGVFAPQKQHLGM